MVIVTNEPSPETEPILEMGYDRIRPIPVYEKPYKYISSMDADPLQPPSVKLALDLLMTAVKIPNMPVIRQCIEHVDLQLNKSNVLYVLSRLPLCAWPEPDKNNFEPSAPPFIEEDNPKNKMLVDEYLESLRHNCLLEIDKHADCVLHQLDVGLLSYEDVLHISTRDTLQITNEGTVYWAILKWACAECRRLTLKHYQINVKAVLRGLVFAPRYGLMSKKEFKSRKLEGELGPLSSGILDEKTWRQILFYIKERDKQRPVVALPYKMSVPRSPGNYEPKVLSSRSMTKGTEQTVNHDKLDSGTTYDKSLLNCLRCWTVFFD